MSRQLTHHQNCPMATNLTSWSDSSYRSFGIEVRSQGSS